MRLSPRKGTKPCYACMVLPFCIMCMAFRRLGNAVPARLTKDVQILVFFLCLVAWQPVSVATAVGGDTHTG